MSQPGSVGELDRHDREVRAVAVLGDRRIVIGGGDLQVLVQDLGWESGWFVQLPVP